MSAGSHTLARIIILSHHGLMKLHTLDYHGYTRLIVKPGVCQPQMTFVCVCVRVCVCVSTSETTYWLLV